jgi:hypothetical protein
MKGTEYFVLLQMSAVITKECNVIINSEELIGTPEYLILQKRCSTNRCCYNRVRLYGHICFVFIINGSSYFQNF